MLNYDMQMKILSEIDLWTLHEMDEFQNAKNDKLYEMCFEKIKDIALFHRNNWKNELYFGPSDLLMRRKGLENKQKKFKHFIVFLADSVYLYKQAFYMTKYSQFAIKYNPACGMYGYLLDQGILGLCCKLYPQFLPEIDFLTTFVPWCKECKNGADQDITGLFRPCWKLNFDLIIYDRRMCISMYPTLPFSRVLCEFVGFDISYIKAHEEVFKNDETIGNLLHIMSESDVDEYPEVILNHVKSVLKYLEDILNPIAKKYIKDMILHQIEELEEWASDNL